MKIRVYKDSAYPYYGVTVTANIYEPELEITEEEYKIICQAVVLERAAQAILARAYKKEKQ